MAEKGIEAAADAIFGDLETALKTARLAQRVPLTPAVTGLQACYYVGYDTPPSDSPANLIHVPMEGLASYFGNADTRLPTLLTLAGMKFNNAADARAWATSVNQLIHEGLRVRKQTTDERIGRYVQRPFDRRRSTGPLRVFAHATRETTVMQHSSRGMIRAFEKLGHEARFLIESNEMQRLDMRSIIEAIEAFDPHLTLSINHLNNNYLPADVVNAVWWQDLMPPLQNPTPLPWRPRDLVYTALANGGMNTGILGTGLSADRIRIQPFCIDTSIFHSDDVGPRADKIVFVGSSARIRLKGGPNEARLEKMIREFVEEGRVLTEEQVFGLGVLCGVDPYQAFHGVFYYVMRDELVRWLCRVPGLKVEVYGRYWDKDPEVAPFYKGELPHGPAVADIYRSAKYAYIVHPISINTQRFAEAAACGCIPVVYDCRSLADAPHWDDRVLFFNTPGVLRDQLRRSLPTYEQEFRRFFSYERFAERILEDAAPFLAGGA